MAQLIPSRSTCLPRMTPGERRLAHRLEDKLEDDYLVWYDVPVGPKQRHPDFLILHPSRGFLILEVKDWKLETIFEFDRMSVTLTTERGRVHVINPLSQARSYANELNALLQADPALRQPSDHVHAGKSIIPYGIGVVLTNITRADFDANDLGDVLPSHKVICQDEMTESVGAEAFQERLWAMFDATFPCRLSLPQIDRFRHHVFPELRIAPQSALFGEPQTDNAVLKIPDLIRVMDLQQEQLARSLGEGHRVIHGVAGSGKTMILGYRCLHLARALAKPVLVLCYNRTLAARLSAMVVEKGLTGKVSVRNFHAWCYDMLRTYHLQKPAATGDAFYEALVPAVIAGVEANAIPRAQYGAVLIDEGHDFQPEWFKLIVQMLDPSTNALLVLYDDAQSIYAGKRRNFSFASVGIEARGRTTILKMNYRNTLEILAVARAFADEALDTHDCDDDSVPLIDPQSAGRRGPFPELVRCGSLQEEAALIAARIREARDQGQGLNDIAVTYRNWTHAQAVADRLQREGISYRWAKDSRQKSEMFDGEPSVKLLTMHSSKGLEFGLVFIPGLCSMPSKSESEAEEARLLYVAMTRAIESVVLTHHSDSLFTVRMRATLLQIETQLASA
jgi:UvrD-like helicase C-terminal domain/Nuclease-related domain/AAA domain